MFAFRKISQVTADIWFPFQFEVLAALPSGPPSGSVGREKTRGFESVFLNIQKISIKPDPCPPGCPKNVDVYVEALPIIRQRNCQGPRLFKTKVLKF